MKADADGVHEVPAVRRVGEGDTPQGPRAPRQARVRPLRRDAGIGRYTHRGITEDEGK